jgi:hypothetical protein
MFYYVLATPGPKLLRVTAVQAISSAVCKPRKERKGQEKMGFRV